MSETAPAYTACIFRIGYRSTHSANHVKFATELETTSIHAGTQRKAHHRSAATAEAENHRRARRVLPRAARRQICTLLGAGLRAGAVVRLTCSPRFERERQAI